MAARKEIEKAVKLKEFQRAVYKLLTAEDQDYLFYAIKEYNTYHSVGKLMLALNSCLDSPEKLDLLPYIRDLIPKHDQKRFDHLAPYDRMAHPVDIKPPTEVPNEISSMEPTNDNIRVIHLQRSKDTPLGFSIRGGQEHDLGIYISHVESFSLAEKAGLKVGDQVVRVNKIDFERVSHSSAVLVLKSHDNLKIEVKNVGQIPGQSIQRDSFLWVDPKGNPVEDDEESPRRQNYRHSIAADGNSSDRLLSSANKHKIVLHSNKKTSLGFSIRGGSEYGLGIYISEVDRGSPSEQAGLRVGDQILDINGHSFHSILHHEAVHILRSYDTLIMTLKSLGRLPVLPNFTKREDSMEGSPSTTRKKPEFFKSSGPPAKTSKRPSSATIVEEEEPEEEEEDQKRRRSASMTTPRSSSVKRSSSIPRSTAGSDEVDSGPPRPRSTSFGNSPFMQRGKKTIAVSPLATHDARATPSPTSPPAMSPIKVQSKFFEKGVGTQVMLASLTSQAEQLLFDKARRTLSPADVEILKEDLDQYEENGDVKQFVACLISIFNTPEKMELLTDIRSLVKPMDIVQFDELISPHEMKAFRKKASDSEDSDTLSIDYPIEYKDDEDRGNYNDLQEESSQRSEDETGQTGMPVASRDHNGFTKEYLSSREKSASLDMNARLQFSLNKESTRASAPELSEVQTKETNLSWYDSDSNSSDSNGSNGVESLPSLNGSNKHKHREAKGTSYPFQNSPTTNRRPVLELSPVVVEVNKDAPYIGLAILVTPGKRILVKDVRPGGAIDRNNFIKPGFEIVQVDNIRIRGKSYHDAAREIADTFKTEGPTVQFVVIPNYY